MIATSSVFIVLISCGILVIIYSLTMLSRNRQVCDLRIWMIDEIFKASKKVDHRDLAERLDLYNKVSYQEMLYSTKPIKAKSFYKDLSFLQ